MSNLYDFPNSNNQDDQEHKCDSCASMAIHHLSHQFESVDDEEVIERYLDKVYEAIEDNDDEAIVDAIADLFYEARMIGNKEVLKDEIHRMSGMLAMLCNEVEGEEQ